MTSFLQHLALSLLLFAGIQQTIRVDVSLVTVGVRVTDSSGREVRGLKGSDFTVFEDGEEQTIAFFSSEPQPMTLGILMDSSSSMESNRKIDRAKEAARALVDGAMAGSEFFYIDFDERVRVGAEFTSDRRLVGSAIDETKADGGTRLYDALLGGISLAPQAQLPRQALVVISDGADQHSRHRLEEVVNAVRKSEIQVFTIGYFSPEEDRLFQTPGAKLYLSNGLDVDNPRLALERISRESGGESFFPKSDRELARAVAAIDEDLKTQYTLSFYPKASDRSGYHRLRVVVRAGAYNARARPGYGALDSESDAPSPFD